MLLNASKHLAERSGCASRGLRGRSGELRALVRRLDGRREHRGATRASVIAAPADRVAVRFGGDYTVITFGSSTDMKTRLVRIGNSRGIRIPKPLIEEAGLSDEVEVRARRGAIVVLPLEGTRTGWADAARKLRALERDRLLDEPSATRFDENEWTS